MTDFTFLRFLRLREPSGLPSIRYLLPGMSAAQRTHRRLLGSCFPGRSRAVAWIAMTWLWLRWVSFGAWRSTANAVRRQGPRVAANGGISMSRQRRDVLRLALCHGLPAQSYYQFELHNPHRRSDMWHYVYDTEAPAFHHMRNRDRGAAATRAQLGDKVGTADLLAAAGIEVAATKAVLPAGSTCGDLPDTGASVWLCKPRNGSRSRGVFRYRRGDAGIDVWTIGGREVSADRHRRFVDRRLAADDTVVQPFYPTHPNLAHLGAAADEAITVRIITERHGDEPAHPDSVYCSWIEVPVKSSTARGYCALTVNPDLGTIDGPAGPILFHDAGVVEQMCAAARGLAVPGWHQLVANAIEAHRCVSGLFAIAWDFVVAPEGPVLLEGNTGFGLTVPQQICGPLLARDAR